MRVRLGFAFFNEGPKPTRHLVISCWILVRILCQCIPLLRSQPSSKMGNGASTTTGVARGGDDQGRAAKRPRTDALSKDSDQTSFQLENDRLKRQLAEVIKERDGHRAELDEWKEGAVDNDHLKRQVAKLRKERDGLKMELDEWKDGDGRRAAVLGRDLSGRPIGTETQKLLNAVAGHTESREIVRLREELYRTKDCLQHVQRLAEEHMLAVLHSEDYEAVVCAGRGHNVLQSVDDPARKERLRAMILEARMPGQMGHYMFGFQKGMMAAGRMYRDFAHAADDEYHEYAEYWRTLTPDERREMAREIFPNGDT